MDCPSDETLLALIASELQQGRREDVQAHIDGGCAGCRERVDFVASLRRLASGVLEDPPAAVLSRACRIPEESRSGGLLAALGKAAMLVFDSFMDPLPAGARDSLSHDRQLLYQALGYDIDVRIGVAGAGLVEIRGQILPGPARPLSAVAGIEVALMRPGATTGTVTSDLGEFKFAPVEPGTYALTVEACDERLVVGLLPAHTAAER